MVLLLVVIFIVTSASCGPVDQLATQETQNLYKNLLAVARNSSAVMFGHQTDTGVGAEGGHDPYLWKYFWHDGGLHGWIFNDSMADEGYPDELSDTKGVTGQYPAVSGADFSNFQYIGKVTYLAKLAYARGQVVTFTQHLDNPVTGGGPWVKRDHTNISSLHIIKRILPGGDKNYAYKANLDRIADWALNFEDANGKLIPFVFRMFHEMNGGWFWWGLGSKLTQNSAQDIINLFRYAVRYLRDTRGVHNIIYAMSPDKFKTKSDYLEVYPGDDYVDVLGTDFYYNKGNTPPVSELKRTLDDLVDIAEARGKIPALTETGIHNNMINSFHNFWNDHILDMMKSDTKAGRVAWIHAWGNHCMGHDRCDLWIPYKGHVAAADFKNNFFNDKMTLFAGDIGKTMYQ